MKRILILIAAAVLSGSQAYGQKIRVLTDQVGYYPSGSKRAVVEAYRGEAIRNCYVKLCSDDSIVAEVKPVEVGRIDQWENWYFWTIDFSSVHREGKYYLDCETDKGSVCSFPFLIQRDVLERHTLSDAVSYFKEQRCVGQMEKADKRMTFADGRKDTVDVHGGWQDATGDYGKHLSGLAFTNYFVTQQIPMVVYSLCKSYQMLSARNDENFRQYKRRILDELLYGADYLVRIKDPKGSFYLSVAAPGAGKLPKDRRIVPENGSFTITKSNSESARISQSSEKQSSIYEASFMTGGGIAIAALAMASQFKVSGDYSSATYLKCAEDAFRYLQKNNLFLDFDRQDNIIDDYCALAAATELYKTTGDEAYKSAADRRAESLMSRLASWGKYKNFWRADNGNRPFFHPTDEGMPVVSLIYYLDICDHGTRAKVLDVIKKSLEFDLAITSEVPNAFGYARELVQHLDGKRNSSFFFPHDTEAAPWWQGEDARIASLACAARLAAPYFKSDSPFADKLKNFADNQLNWILGLNPFDMCMMNGVGYNNPEYMFFGSYQYAEMPGGISNGITCGLDNPHGIAFDIPYSVTGKDYDWRWTEQWLPHDAWFLMAVSAGQ